MNASEFMRQIESFFWGIVAALGALFVELLVYIAATSSGEKTNLSFTELFLLPIFLVIAALTEEIFKYIIISKRIELYSLAKSYVINSLFVGAGFAATEFSLMIYAGTKIPPQVFAELSIIHLGTAGIIGFMVATKNPGKISTFLSATLAATLFHASYNFLIQKREYFENYAILAILGFLILANLYNLLRISSKLAQE